MVVHYWNMLIRTLKNWWILRNYVWISMWWKIYNMSHKWEWILDVFGFGVRLDLVKPFGPLRHSLGLILRKIYLQSTSNLVKINGGTVIPVNSKSLLMNGQSKCRLIGLINWNNGQTNSLARPYNRSIK